MRYKFTGKERDSESGLDYFGARYYGSSMGRFMSSDDGEDQDVQDPQSWNLYSYVRNNPVTHTDADGRAVNVCDASGQNCHTIWDDQAYSNAQQQDKQLNGPSLSQLQNSGQSQNITDSNGNVVGTAQWIPNNPGIDGPANAAIFGQIGNQGIGAIKTFVAGSVVGGAIGGAALTAAGTEAGLSILTENLEGVLSRAGSSVGNQGAKVASREVAEEAAKKWVGEGARPLVDRGTGKVIGEISADGTKIARWTSAEKTQPYINLVNKLTGSNLHVGW